MSQQISAIDRLRTLPEFFHGRELAPRFQWTSKEVSQYLYLWKRRGLVQGLGGHSDVYANMMRYDNPHWEKAVKMSMPSAVLIGIDILRGAGWTTQIQRCPSIAVQKGASTYKVEHFTVEQRPESWYAKVRNEQGLVQDTVEPNYLFLPMLRPAWALADMLCYEGWGGCGLHPDDLYDDEMTARDEDDWQAACAAFNLSAPFRKPLVELVEPSR
ncbi:hypothetical protein AGMMS49545_04610 [Betaproteobacteria bacterium]|nr:hypothetical protein AGMMS49545_04610 [Betaproteobacteria bacterium]GHU41202.1 hypothetical protein AGMMS50289_03990 [Betaproteobacteria bacterium]